MVDCNPEKTGSLNNIKSDFDVSEVSVDKVSDNEIELKHSEKSEETIGRMLSTYAIGQKLRRLRLRKKIALVDLGKHTGLSASLLSQLENGKIIPTLPTLSRIALVFDVGLEYFFDYNRSQRAFAVTRASDRLRFPDRPDSPSPSFFFEVLAYGATEKRMSAYLAEFPPRSGKEVHEHYHDGWELVHVLSGSLAISYEGNDHILDAGDSVYFNSLEPHSYRGHSQSPAQAIVVTTQPHV